MDDKTILKVEDLTVEFNGTAFLNNLSFQVKEGEVLTILGPNGAGKTILLKALLGLIPFKGKIIWQEGVKIGYVPQRLPFIKDIPMSVGEFLKLKNVSNREIAEILQSIHLEKDILKKTVGDLSSGQFQRVLVGWALLSGPHVLLFDEPTTGIDIGGQETIYDFLEKLQKERNLTILLVTHDLSVVYELASHCLCLNKKMISYSLPKDLDSSRLSQLYGGEVKFHHHNHDQ